MRWLLILAIVAPWTSAQNPTGALTGREIVLSPGHGYYWHSTIGWTTQRPLIDGLIEDIHTHEIVHDHLLPWLDGMGARTILCRARSRTVEEHVIHNEDGFPAYSETGAWATSASAGWQGTSYRFASTSPAGGSTASFRTTITTTDHYPVYVAYRGSNNRTTAARIEVDHAAGTSVRTIDQTRFDRRWLYVGTFPFRAMETAVVRISSQSNAPGVIISDAVKIGDGYGSISRGGSTSGQLRWRECCRYHAQYFGAPSSVWNPSTGPNDNSDDVTCRPLFGEWYADGQADLYLSLHTNAGGGSGTSTFIHNTAPTAGSPAWQATLHSRLINDIRNHWDPTWIDRGQQSANFGEVRELQTMPGCLIELAFHDDIGGDIEDLHHPDFRQISGRAMARAIVEYLAPGTPLPLDPPTAVAMRNTGGGTLEVSWGTVSGASAYRVSLSEDGFAFDDGTVVTGTSHPISGLANDAVRFVKVAAVNAAGAGIDSEPVGARVAPNGGAPLLLVNGFDRRDRSIKEAANPRDWLVIDGAAVQGVLEAGYPFDGCTNEAVATAHVVLTPYRCVGWVLGEESTADETFNIVEQLRINLYLNAGGRLFFSGAEVGWDLDAQGSTLDRNFYESILGQDYIADDANTHWTQAQSSGPLGALPAMMFDDGSWRSDVDWPDVIGPAAASGGQIVLRYATGAGAGVLSGSGRVLGIGFPMEALISSSHRALLMERVLRLMCPLPVRAASVSPQIGATTAVTLDFPASGGFAYLAAASSGTSPGIPLPDGRTVPVNQDLLFQLSFMPGQSILTSMSGTLDPSGQGSFQISLPNDPSLIGFSAWFSAVTLSPAGDVAEIAPWVKLTAQ